MRVGDGRSRAMGEIERKAKRVGADAMEVRPGGGGGGQLALG